MDGVHDLGGKPGHGSVDKDGEHEVFHERWEAAVFAMVAVGAKTGAWNNSDRFRHAIERINTEAYLTHGYYGRWLGGIENLLIEAGVVTEAEINARAQSLGAGQDDLIAAQPSATPDPIGPSRSSPGSIRPLEREPQYGVGDQVTTLSDPVPGHTRLPAYARGRTGEVIAQHDGWVLPDTSAHGLGEQPAHLYTIRFSSDELWQRPGFSVCLDLFEPYLLPAH